VLTRYDKLDVMFAAFVLLTLTVDALLYLKEANDFSLHIDYSE
jgi:hypothetical protein